MKAHDTEQNGARRLGVDTLVAALMIAGTTCLLSLWLLVEAQTAFSSLLSDSPLIVLFACFGLILISAIVLVIPASVIDGRLVRSGLLNKDYVSGLGGGIATGVFVLVNLSGVAGVDLPFLIARFSGEDLLTMTLVAGIHGFVCWIVMDEATTDTKRDYVDLSQKSTFDSDGTTDHSSNTVSTPGVDRPSTTTSRNKSVPAQQSSSDASPAESRGALDDLEYSWQRDTEVTMRDVGGLEEVKECLRRDVIRTLDTDDETLVSLGIEPENVLLYGPPGTGKTHIAKAVATEVSVPFVQLSGSDVTSKWINESASKVQQLFEEAERVADEHGGAIVFLDEVDSLLSNRDGQTHEENRKVVNQFLNSLQETARNVVVLGATNRYDDLDQAAIRRGRFDHHIEVGLPDLQARSSILEAQLRNRQNALDRADIRKLANQTEGYSGADLAGLVEDAAKHAAYDRDDDTVRLMDFSDAL